MELGKWLLWGCKLIHNYKINYVVMELTRIIARPSRFETST